MRITCFCLLLGLSLTLAADANRPKKKDDRGKRQLDYSLSHFHPAPPAYRSDRRTSAPQPPHPAHLQYQYFPGPPRSYHKDHQDIDNQLEDGIDRKGKGGKTTIVVPNKPLIIEKPVYKYIKEPEPIIEIIIKESNITLPPEPTEPPTPPPKKKKEEVQVFYVKYKKNPGGYGKDAIIYDKPIPAISPEIPEEPEEVVEHPQPEYYNEDYPPHAPPPPSTTQRAIIKPDSEYYESPTGLKITFGKEGFDYEKRSSKPEDYSPQDNAQAPQARQLSSFSSAYFRRPGPGGIFPASSNTYKSEVRPPQPYRPFTFPSASNSRPSNGFSSQPRYPFQSPPYTKPSGPGTQYSEFPPSRGHFPQFSHSVSHPAPPQFNANSQPPRPQFPPNPQPPKFQAPQHFNEPQRKPVAYKPFSNLKPSQPSFTHQQPTEHHQFAPQQHQPLPTHHAPQRNQQQFVQQPAPVPTQQIPFRPETHFPVHQQLPLTQQDQVFRDQNFGQQQSVGHTSHVNHQQQPQRQPVHQENPHLFQQLSTQFLQNNGQQVVQYKHLNNIPPQPQHGVPPSQYQQQLQHHQQHQQQQHVQQKGPNDEHLNNLYTAQNLLPPGGELIQSLPKFEQHIVFDPSTGKQIESSPLTSSQEQGFQNQPQLSKQNDRQSEYRKEQRLQVTQQRSNEQVYSTERPAVYHSTQRSQTYTSSPRAYHSTSKPTTTTTTTTTEEPQTPSTTTKDPKVLEAQLPDEVPDDLRAQLLSSGILNNADISILDYDKVGDIPLSALPPDQLANFYNAGGAQQLAGAGSNPVPQVVKYNAESKSSQDEQEDDMQEAEASERHEVRVEPEVKVVRYNPDTDKGQEVQEAYVKEDAQQTEPVVLNDNTYNRYLPLKVNGTQFPIPDVPELKGKKISSVVVLAPVTFDFSSERKTRETKKTNDIDLIQGKELKALLADPTMDNFLKFLESQNKTAAVQQSVILLVTGPKDGSSDEKEIYMYDVPSKTVSKLSGELSSAFVEAAEANSSDDEQVPSASEIVEDRVPFDENQVKNS